MIGPIYYEYGSMVITFDNSESALNALDQLKVSKQEYEGGKKILGESAMCPHLFMMLSVLMFDDKTLNNALLPVILLPTVNPSMIAPGVIPLLVFVNVRAGGGQGMQLKQSFRKLLNPHQVSHQSVLYSFRESGSE